MPDRCVKLPKVPFDGQIYIDYQRIKWRWDATNKVWWRIGTSDTIPPADSTTTGLLKAPDKVMLDSIPSAGGGFGLIVAPQLILSSPYNPSGVLQGDLTLYSHSMLIECVDRYGLTINGQLSSNDPLDVINDPVPGLRFSLSTEFLSTSCLEIYSPEGHAGEKGDTGADGRDGYTNSPAGEKGDIGRSTSLGHTFSGVKIVDVTGTYDKAVVNLELNQDDGILSYTMSMMNVPEDDEPADQLTVIPTSRTLTWQPQGEYTTLDDWVLGIPSGDQIDSDPDLVLLQMPGDAELGGSIELSRVQLTDFLTQVTGHYKDILTSYEEYWEKQVKSFIEEKDSQSRVILAGLAHQLSECEWVKPLEFCLGISGSDCGPQFPPTVTTSAPTTAAPVTTAAPTTTDPDATTGEPTTTDPDATTAEPSTTLPVIRTPWCQTGTFLANPDHWCVTLSRSSIVGNDAVCCLGVGGLYGYCDLFRTHRLDKVPNVQLWQKYMGCVSGSPANNPPCIGRDQHRLYLTVTQSPGVVHFNLILEDDRGNPTYWFETSLLEPVNCDDPGDGTGTFNGQAMQAVQINNDDCGIWHSTGAPNQSTVYWATLHNVLNLGSEPQIFEGGHCLPTAPSGFGV